MIKKAVFLDRDGVINRKGPSYYIYLEEDFILNEGVTDALRHFATKGFLLVVITNQGGIAKKFFTEEQLSKLHELMIHLLEKEGVRLTAIYYCPHHPDVSDCQCRKPGTLLFERAIRDLEIDPSASFMIGDSESDMIAAEKMGIKGILIPANGNMEDLIVRKGII